MSKLIKLICRHSSSSMSMRPLSTTSALRDIFKVQDEQDFQQKVLNSKSPVIVEFYATWCGPCKVLMPRLESVAARKNINLAKVDIDHLEDVVIDLNVDSVPTVMAFKNGRVIDQFSGIRDEDQLDAFVDKLQA